MTGRETVCRVEPALVDHVQQLLADAGLTTEAQAEDRDGLIAVQIDIEDSERARSVIGLVLPQLLEPPANQIHLSDRLIRSEDPGEPATPTGLPGGLVDGRSISGYADPLSDSSDYDDGADYAPPIPPPIPRPTDRLTTAAWIAVIGGPVLLILVHLIGLSSFWTAVGLAAFIAGFAALVARMDDGPRSDDGSDDGAVV